MPAYPHIQRYREELARLIEAGGSDSELNIRPAFQNCLAAYCAAHKEKLTLVPELSVGGVRPDGTVKDTLRMARGYWEAKDTRDDLDAEIQSKFNGGYPRDNIIFEDSRTAVLYQNREETMRVDMNQPGKLHQLIRRFLDYELPQIEEFRQAQTQFKNDLPTVIANLREAVEEAETNNAGYQAAAASFLELCRKAIGPKVSQFDVKEMLLQHILTEDIFLRVFGEDRFYRKNNVARQLDALEDTFFTGDVRREAKDRLRAYYGAIGRSADEIADFAEKQQFLKAIYEDFYQAYNPEAADYLGVVYTPNEIVDFIIQGTDLLLQRHFGRTLADDNVQILDPATGTGTFITGLIDYLPAERLEYKYRNEIHANEVAILPYYIANMNIEYSYKEKTGNYLEFPHLVFVDTLDNTEWQGATGGAVIRQSRLDDLGALSEQNWRRLREQNEKPISVIIGNPPYNDSAILWGDGRDNWAYPEIDQRIKETYVQEGTAQKTHQYDMYKRFIRWASDRLDDDGVIAFVSNNAFLNSRQDDGFRKVVEYEFNELWAIDLKGNARTSGERRRKEGGNIFENKIRVGVAIYFLVRRQDRNDFKMFYTAVEDYAKAPQKAHFIRNKTLKDFQFEQITPDAKQYWLNQPPNNDFEKLVPLAHKRTGAAKSKGGGKSVFKLMTNAVKSNRDDWVYDFDVGNLRNKALFFADTYNEVLDRNDESYPPIIKWSSTLRDRFKRGEHLVYSDANRLQSLYRPFVSKHYFAETAMNDRLTRNHYEMFGQDLRQPNTVINLCVNGKQFYALAAKGVTDFRFTGDTQCLPLYRYTPEGERVSNITDWAVRAINEQYRREWGKHFEKFAGKESITAEDIFAYIYGVLNDPVYQYDYRFDLLRDFPRLPLYYTFDDFSYWGRELLDLHTEFESAEPFELERVDSRVRGNDGEVRGNDGEVRGNDGGKAILKAGKEKGLIVLDEDTTLAGVPEDAWRYKLGSRSALEWVLDQYKEKKPRDPAIRKKFNTYRFADHKESVIDLLKRVCTVSVKTMEVLDSMAFWHGEHLVVMAERYRGEWTMMGMHDKFKMYVDLE